MEDQKRDMGRTLGRILSIVTIVVCAVLHIASFLALVPPMTLLLPVALIAATALCVRAFGAAPKFSMGGPTNVVGWVLLAHSIFTFVYFYKITGGANSVDTVNGQYVSMDKGRVIRQISEYEYRFFPTLWVRVMSAWIAMAAAFALRPFASGGKKGEEHP